MLAAAGLLLMVAVFWPKATRRDGLGGRRRSRVRRRASSSRSSSTTRRRTAATIVADSIFRDRWAATAQMIVAACGLVAVLVAYRERMREENIAEYYALLAAAGAGMAFFVQAASLMTLFLGLEWFSIALYVLCAIDIDLVGSLEAGLKYLIVGAVGSATLLFGSALVYGATGELSFDKIAAAGARPRLAARARPRDDARRVRVQGLGGAVPHVDARRLPGRADARDRVHVERDEGRRARRHVARPRHRVPRGAAPLDVGRRRDRDHLARRRQHRRARAAERQAAARLLVGLARGLHADRGRRRERRSARGRSCTT